MLQTTLVKEKPTTFTYTNHDQLAKELISNFFEEFLEAFFPEVHENVDFTAISPVSEEVYTDLLNGRSRRLDIVIETKLKGNETVLLIHVEPQSYYEHNFKERMYHYFSLLYNKYQKPILPIAIFSYEDKKDEQKEFTMQFPFFHVLTFNFLMLELRKKNWRDYIQSDNPVAAALLSKMGYTEEEKVEIKKEFLQMLIRMELNPAKARFISGFFEVYLRLNEEEEEQLMKEIQQLDNSEEIFELANSWEKKGLADGKKEVAVELLKEGSPIEFVSKVTHLSKEEVEELKKQL